MKRARLGPVQVFFLLFLFLGEVFTFLGDSGGARLTSSLYGSYRPDERVFAAPLLFPPPPPCPLPLQNIPCYLERAVTVETFYRKQFLPFLPLLKVLLRGKSSPSLLVKLAQNPSIPGLPSSSRFRKTTPPAAVPLPSGPHLLRRSHWVLTLFKDTHLWCSL